jgi:hypothetical protein
MFKMCKVTYTEQKKLMGLESGKHFKRERTERRWAGKQADIVKESQLKSKVSYFPCCYCCAFVGLFCSVLFSSGLV